MQNMKRRRALKWNKDIFELSRLLRFFKGKNFTILEMIQCNRQCDKTKLPLKTETLYKIAFGSLNSLLKAFEEI